MNLLASINDFGAIDAESDERLIEYFYRTQIIDELLEYQKSVIIGRKGSGKTAIYKFMKSEKSNSFSALLFSDYPWRIHDRFKNNIVSERESYVNSWTFYFYIEIFKRLIVLKNNTTNKAAQKSVIKLGKWLKRNWGSTEFDHKDVMSPIGKRFVFTFNPQILGNSLGSISRDFVSGTDVSSTLVEYNKKFASILDEIIMNFSGEIILGFDELDLAYDPADMNYKNRLIGLLLTAYSFYQKYREKVKVFIFLRSDIFNILEFQDKNKIKDNMVEFLDWDSESTTSKLSLKNMISNRIKTNIGWQYDNFERNWNEVFENNNIGRNQAKWNFIVERTFVRPRDVIKFLNLALEEAKAQINADPDRIDKITNADIHAIRSKYSTYLFEELNDEISSKYSDYQKYLEILRHIHRVLFTRDDFSSSYDNVSSRMDIDASLDVVMERLYEFSIIGFYKPGGGGYGGSEYRYRYNSDSQAFNPQASKFKVHSGFKEYLELIE